MAIDWQKANDESRNLRYEPVRSLAFEELEGVEVAWARCVPNEGEPFFCMVSDESFATLPDPNGHGHVRVVAPELHDRCKEAKRRASQVWLSEFREENQERWARLSPEEVILDVFERVLAGEWLGQFHDRMIYAQEVSTLLGYDKLELEGKNNPIYEHLYALKAQEKIELNGNILLAYRHRFRLPDELRHIIAYMVEEPLGWPNGDAGECTVQEIEEAIQKGTHFQHGKDLVWEHNFPHIDPRLLLSFGSAWVKKAVEALEAERATTHEDYRDRIAESLEQLARRLRRTGT